MVAILPISDNLYTIKVDLGIRIDPVLGGLKGKLVTFDSQGRHPLQAINEPQR